ncbi:phosphoribosylanthranilate isomerase [bacterium]|nr:phosphoribosylanthranilate isomerase [bacterium]
MKIKICGLQRADQIKSILGLAPDYIGLIFVPASKRFIGEDLNILSALQSKVATSVVGVFQSPEIEFLTAMIGQYQLDAVQIYHLNPKLLDTLRTSFPKLEIIEARNVKALSDLTDSNADLLLLDSQVSGSGEVFDWQLLDAYRGNTPFMLAGGIAPELIPQIKETFKKHPRFIGIDLNSKLEDAPGTKNIEKVKAAIAAGRL